MSDISDLLLDATAGLQNFKDDSNYLIGKAMEADSKLSAAKAEKLVALDENYIYARNNYNQFKALIAFLDTKFQTFGKAAYAANSAAVRDQRLLERS